MGIDLKSQPDSFRSKLTAVERKKLGKHGMTAAEATESYKSGQEKILQEDVASFFDLNNIYYVRSRMDRKTTMKKGTPDFLACVGGQFLAVECKCENGRISPEQDKEILRIMDSGGEVMVAHNLKSVISAVRELQSKPNYRFA